MRWETESAALGQPDLENDLRDQGWGSRTAGPEPGQQIEESAVAAVCRIAVTAALEMSLHLRRLFRSEFAVQIFPEAGQNLFTFHSLHPR
jgi:hypothetical protein